MGNAGGAARDLLGLPTGDSHAEDLRLVFDARAEEVQIAAVSGPAGRIVRSVLDISELLGLWPHTRPYKLTHAGAPQSARMMAVMATRLPAPTQTAGALW